MRDVTIQEKSQWQGKANKGLAWDARVRMYTSETAGGTKDGMGSRNHGDDQGREYKSKCRQEKSNEGI